MNGAHVKIENTKACVNGIVKNDLEGTKSFLGYVANSLNATGAWCKHVGGNQKSSTKNIYNYGTTHVRGNNKTSMCRIAELTRYHKLRHEYILMDENGPAHMKYFTVKLVLCPGEEYNGHGPSIKKAQEAAANTALRNTTLKSPPSRNRCKSDLDPVALLNQLAYKLDLTVDYEYETICIPIKINSNDSQEISSIGDNATKKPQNLYRSDDTSILPLSGIPTPVSFLSFYPSIPIPLSTPPPLPISHNFALNFNPMLSHLSDSLQYMPFSSNSFEQIQSAVYKQILKSTNYSSNNNDDIVKFTPKSLQSLNVPSTTTSLLQSSILHFLPQSGKASSLLNQRQNVNCISNNNGYNLPSNLHVLPPCLPPPASLPIVNFLPFVPHLSTPIPKETNHLPNLDINQKTFNNNNVNLKNSMGKKNIRVFRTTLKLSDESAHTGVAADKITSKSNAATQALYHLRPQLQKLQEKIQQSTEPTLNDKANSTLRIIGCREYAENEDVANVVLEFTANLSLADERNPVDDDDVNNNNGERENLENAVIEKHLNLEVSDKKTAHKRRKKSIITLIHERAVQLRMNVEFENISTDGQAHERRFIVRCRLFSPREFRIIEADGEGTSKKLAKQKACQQIYEKIKDLEKDPIYLASLVVKKARRNSSSLRQSKTEKRKILVKQRRCDPQYGQWVNPVCRLMQVMQSSGKPDPVFKLLGENGHNKYKEFIVQVTCSDTVAEGRSQNKRLAKRAAADEMLRLLGYAKQMPKPGKSLLKKTKDDAVSVEIGVFDSEVLFTAASDSEKSYYILDTNVVDFDAKTSMDSIDTFADVDDVLKIEDLHNDWIHVEPNINNNNDEDIRVSGAEIATNLSYNTPATVATRPEESTTVTKEWKEEPSAAAVPIRKRRVTFNNQVSACPPPDDDRYPQATIAPLKSEVLFVNGRMRKRGRDSKKVLTDDEKNVLTSITGIFLKHRKQLKLNSDDSTQGPVHDGDALKSPKSFLDVIAKTHKFSVIYSDFPTTDDRQCFSLVTLGIDKPVVCSGSGNTQDESHEDAALNAIKILAKLDGDTTTQAN